MAEIKSKIFANMRKKITKKYDDIIMDLEEPKIWATSGNFVLNHILSGQFGRGYPSGRITQLFGLSGAGKSFLIAKAIAEAQKDGYMVLVLDSEQALSQDYLSKIGVSTDPDKLLTLQVTTVEQTQDMMIDILNDIRETQKTLGNNDEIKLLLIMDSIGALVSNKALMDAEKGHHAADMGTKAKALTKMFSNITQKIGLTDTVCILTNHSAKEVGVMFPQELPKGGKIMEFIPSISLRTTKGKIKPSDLEELGFLYGGEVPKHIDTLGIVTRIELYKSRFTRPFRKVQLQIPYDMGLHKHAGLFTYLYTNGLLVSENRKGYYNYKFESFEKDFTRKKFIEDGYADIIIEDLLKREKDGEVFDFIMKSSEDIEREKIDGSEDDIEDVIEEINDSIGV